MQVLRIFFATASIFYFLRAEALGPSCLRGIHKAQVNIALLWPANARLLKFQDIDNWMGRLHWAVHQLKDHSAGRWRFTLEVPSERDVARAHLLAVQVMRGMHQESILMYPDRPLNYDLRSNLQFSFTWWRANHNSHSHPTHQTLAYGMSMAPESLEFLRRFNRALREFTEGQLREYGQPLNETRVAYRPSGSRGRAISADDRDAGALTTLADLAFAQVDRGFSSTDRAFVFSLSPEEWTSAAARNGFRRVWDYQDWLLRPIDTLP